MIEGGIGGDPADPRAKASGRVETGSPAIRPPECFDKHINRRAAIADDPHDPAIDVGLDCRKSVSNARFDPLNKPLE
jgi:hypothetical protein